jgi:hypothetical protein
MLKLFFAFVVFCYGSLALKVRQLRHMVPVSTCRIAQSIGNADANRQSARPVIVHIVSKKETRRDSHLATGSSAKRSTGRKYTTYKEAQSSNVLEKISDSPITTFFGYILNPTTMLLTIYLSSIGWSKVLWVQVKEMLNIFHFL